MKEVPTTIVPYVADDRPAVMRLLLEAFHSKFSSLVNLPDEQLMQLLLDTQEPWEQAGGAKQMVMKENGQIIGVMLLKWLEDRTSSRKQTRGQQHKRKQPSCYFLASRYGLLNVCRFMAGMRMLRHTPTAREYYIEHIAIQAESRGRGIGTKFIEWARQFASEQDKGSRLTLYVAADNYSARGLYKKLGFVDTRTEQFMMTNWLFNQRYWVYMTANHVSYQDGRKLEC